MRKFEEIINELNSYLKDNLTAENTDFIQKTKGLIDELDSAHNGTKEENSKLKDKIVDQVKFTSFKEDKREDPVGKELTIDEILAQKMKELNIN